MSRKLTAAETKELQEFARVAFDTFDTDKSGEINVKELEGVLRQFNDSSACKEKVDEATIKKTSEDFIRSVDKNADGKLTYEELYKFILVVVDAHE